MDIVPFNEQDIWDTLRLVYNAYQNGQIITDRVIRGIARGRELTGEAVRRVTDIWIDIQAQAEVDSERMLEDGTLTNYIPDFDALRLQREQRDVATRQPGNMANPQEGSPQLTSQQRQEDRDIEDTLSNLQDTTQEESMEPPTQVMRTSAMQDISGTRSGRETQVDYNVTPEFGFLTNTRTSIQRYSAYLSVNKLGQATPETFALIMNNNYSFIRCALVQQNVPNPVRASATSGSDVYSDRWALRQAGVSNDKANDKWFDGYGIEREKATGVNYCQLLQFPWTETGLTAGGTNPKSNTYGNLITGNPAWRNYYERVYSMKHVMQCKWKLTMLSGHTNTTVPRVKVVYNTETLTAAGNASVLPTNRPFRDVVTWPGLKTVSVKPKTEEPIQNDFTIASGIWKYTDSSKNREVIDEDQVKVWYPTETADFTPLWEEYVRFLFYADEFSDQSQPCINIRIDLEWTIQYKDPKAAYVYPLSSNTTAMLQVNDMLQARTKENASWAPPVVVNATTTGFADNTSKTADDFTNLNSGIIQFGANDSQFARPFDSGWRVRNL